MSRGLGRPSADDENQVNVRVEIPGTFSLVQAGLAALAVVLFIFTVGVQVGMAKQRATQRDVAHRTPCP